MLHRKEVAINSLSSGTVFYFRGFCYTVTTSDKSRVTTSRGYKQKKVQFDGDTEVEIDDSNFRHNLHNI